jgi:hypothetical protein
MAHSKIISESYPYDLPLTSRDSDNEDTSVHTPVAHKRSASEMDDEHDNPGLTAVQEGPSNGPEAIGTEIHASFIIECPALSAILEKTTASDAYSERDHPAPAPELSIQFTVRPGRSGPVYPDTKLPNVSGALTMLSIALMDIFASTVQDPVAVIYSFGQIVYVNRRMPPPPVFLISKNGRIEKCELVDRTRYFVATVFGSFLQSWNQDQCIEE